MQIHPTSLEFESLPSIYTLLDSIVFMWFIILVTLGVIAWVIAKVWYVHSIPKHLAKEKGLAQAKLIFWMCILGLVWKPLWVLAVLAIVTDWDKVQTWFRGAQS